MSNDYLPFTSTMWEPISKPPIPVTDASLEKAGSFKGRGYCLIHLLALPLKAIAYSGKRLLTIADIFHRLIAAVTFNAPPKEILKAITGVVDLFIGTALLPFALAANMLRSLFGMVFHPGLMLRTDVGLHMVDRSPALTQTVVFY